MWYQKYSLPSTKFLGVVACRVTSKIPGVGSVDRSWGDVKKYSQAKYHLWAVTFMRSIVLCIHMLSLMKKKLR